MLIGAVGQESVRHSPMVSAGPPLGRGIVQGVTQNAGGPNHLETSSFPRLTSSWRGSKMDLSRDYPPEGLNMASPCGTAASREDTACIGLSIPRANVLEARWKMNGLFWSSAGRPHSIASTGWKSQEPEEGAEIPPLDWKSVNNSRP